MRLSWNRAEDGVVTVYATTADGRICEVADFWVKPMMESFGITRSIAQDYQQQFAELLVTAHNRLFTPATQRDSAAPLWVCPLGKSGCLKNCGSYGCGN